MTSPRAWSVALFFAASVATSPRLARANGRYPAAGQIAIDPADPSHVIARATYGLLTTRDLGGAWSWICEPAVGIDDYQDPMIAVTGKGTILVANPSGLSISRDGGCSWAPPAGSLAHLYATDLTIVRSDPARALVIASAAVGPDERTEIWGTTDDGASFTQVGAALPVSDYGLTVDVAPSDPSRVYVSARKSPAGVLLRSKDGGATFTELPIAGADDAHLAYIAGVDPNHPDIVYVRLDGDPVDTLVATIDGGETWKTLYTSQGALSGFALSPDGSLIALGGPIDALSIAKASGGAFEKVSSVGPRCLTWTKDAMFACADELASGFTVGRSVDGGVTFTPMMHRQALCGPLECAATTSVGAVCPALWSATQMAIGALACAAPAATSVASSSGAPSGSASSGCAFAMSPEGGAASSLAAVAFGIAAIACRKRARGRRAISACGPARSRRAMPTDRGAHGFDWSGKGKGLAWEENGGGAPVLTAGAIGDAVVVYHRYCMGLPEAPFRDLFRRTGAIEMGSWQSERPTVVIHGRGRNDEAIREVERYLEKVRAERYASDVKEAPPWGSDARDERLLSDEDRDARLSDGRNDFEVRGDAITLSLRFQNVFAGSIAVEKWLSDQGFTDIRVTMERFLDEVQPASTPCEPRIGLFGDVLPEQAPWESVSLAKVSDEQVVEWIFSSGGLSKEIIERLETVNPAIRMQHITNAASRRWGAGEFSTRVIEMVADWLRDGASDLVRALWGRLPEQDLAARFAAIRAMAVSLPRDEGYLKSCEWVRNATQPREAMERLGGLGPLRDSRFIGLWEETLRRGGSADEADFDAIARAVADSRASWSTLAAWVRGSDRALARIAVRVLRVYSGKGAPLEFERSDVSTLTKLLEDYIARGTDGRETKLVREILKYPTALVHDAEGL